MARVYIVNKGGHDYSDAKRYGELHFLSEGQISKYAANKIYRKFAIQLRESTNKDWILITSLTVMACIACSCFAVLHGRLNLLLFKNGRYVDRKLVLTELLTSEKGSGGELE